MILTHLTIFLFCFNYTATTGIYTYCHTLSLHDALPISSCLRWRACDSSTLTCASSWRQRALNSRSWSAATTGASLVTAGGNSIRSEEHTSELQSLMRISYAVFCLKKKKHERKYN